MDPADTDTCDVVVLGFEPGAEPPAARLQRVFGIDAVTASALLAQLPATVQRGVVLVRGEYFRRALQAIGARVVLRDPRGELIAPELPVARAAAVSMPAPRASVRGSAPTVPHPAPSPVAEPPPAVPAPASSWNGSDEQPDSDFDPMSATLAQHGGHRPADLRAAQPPARPSVPAPPLRVGAATLREAVPAAARGSGSPAAPAHATALELPLRAAPTAFGPGARSAAAVPLPRPEPPSLELPSLELPSLEPPSLELPSLEPPAAAAPWAPVAPAPFAPFAPSAPLAWGGLAAAPPAMWAAGLPESALLVSRDPSSVFDPPPPPPAPRAVAVSLPPAAGALSLELTGSPFGLGAGAREALAAAVLQPWEQPDRAEMAEPPLPSSRPPVRARARPSQQPSRRPAVRVSSPNDTVATRAGSSAAPPVQVGVADRARAATRPVLAHDPRSFWQSIGPALALPFSGSGPYWIFAIGAWSVAVGVLGFLSSFLFLIGLIVMFLAHTSLIAFACDYYRVCLWQPVVGEDEIDIAPSFDAPLLLDRYLRSGMHLSLFAIASQIPVIAWLSMSLLDGEPLFAVLGNPLTWFLFVFPYVYWPMGVGIAALANDSSSIWNVVAGLRAIIRAPLEYLTIVIIGLGVLVVSWTLLALCGSLLGAAGAVLSGTVGLPLALSHGIQGALMGHLARTRSEIFE